MLIYTTNALKGFNIQPRKITKIKTVFLTGDSPLKIFYLAMMDIAEKWTGKRRGMGCNPVSVAEAFFAN